MATAEYGGDQLHLTLSSVSEIERAKKPQTLEGIWGRQNWTSAQYWKHTVERNRGRIRLWSFNHPNPVFKRFWEAYFYRKKYQNSIKTRNTAKDGHNTPLPQEAT